LVVAFAGCGDDGPTVGDRCQDVMQAFCSRAFKECTQSPSDYDACVSVGKAACCANHCDATAASNQSSIDQCKTEMHALDCTSVTGTTPAVPASCQGVVRAASFDPVDTPTLAPESMFQTALSVSQGR
jgi:hypothetical protein